MFFPPFRRREFFSCCMLRFDQQKMHHGQDFHEDRIRTQVHRRSLPAKDGNRPNAARNRCIFKLHHTQAISRARRTRESSQYRKLSASLPLFSMAGPDASPRISITSSLASSHEFSVSRVLSNGNGGVVASVIWLVISAGLCFPWLLEQPSATKAGDTPKSVAWFLVLALDLLIGTMSVFSLWFQRSTLSIILLIWGAGGILATFVMGSFAMLPAVATM